MITMKLGSNNDRTCNNKTNNCNTTTTTNNNNISNMKTNTTNLEITQVGGVGALDRPRVPKPGGPS